MSLSDLRLYIALGGKAGHGKTTLAAMLKAELERRGMTVHITSFATVPKRMLSAMGLTHEQLYGNLKEVPFDDLGDNSPRYLMQTLATEWGRNMLYDEVWVDAWEREVQKLPAYTVVIVDDLRHVPELKRLVEKDAHVFEVYRPARAQKGFRNWLKQFFVHSSERLDFRLHGVRRLEVVEGQPDLTLKMLLASIPVLQ